MPLLIELLKKFKVKSAYLFGSVLTNSFSKNSDIDILVNYDEKMDPLEMGENLMDLYIALQDGLKKRVDLLTERSLKNPYFIQEINATKLKIYEN